jgi:hypothetical protein
VGMNVLSSGCVGFVIYIYIWCISGNTITPSLSLISPLRRGDCDFINIPDIARGNRLVLESGACHKSMDSADQSTGTYCVIDPSVCQRGGNRFDFHEAPPNEGTRRFRRNRTIGHCWKESIERTGKRAVRDATCI